MLRTFFLTVVSPELVVYLRTCSGSRYWLYQPCTGVNSSNVCNPELGQPQMHLWMPRVLYRTERDSPGVRLVVLELYSQVARTIFYNYQCSSGTSRDFPFCKTRTENERAASGQGIRVWSPIHKGSLRSLPFQIPQCAPPRSRDRWYRSGDGIVTKKNRVNSKRRCVAWAWPVGYALLGSRSGAEWQMEGRHTGFILPPEEASLMPGDCYTANITF